MDEVGPKQKDSDLDDIKRCHGVISQAFYQCDRSKLWEPWLFSTVKRWYASKLNKGAVGLTAAANGLPVGQTKEETTDLLLKYQVYPLSLAQLERIMQVWEALSADEKASLSSAHSGALRPPPPERHPIQAGNFLGGKATVKWDPDQKVSGRL